MLKTIFENADYKAFENAGGTRIIIERDEMHATLKPYYKIAARRPGEKFETIATRCTLEKAFAILNEFDK